MLINTNVCSCINKKKVLQSALELFCGCNKSTLRTSTVRVTPPQTTTLINPSPSDSLMLSKQTHMLFCLCVCCVCVCVCVCDQGILIDIHSTN